MVKYPKTRLYIKVHVAESIKKKPQISLHLHTREILKNQKFLFNQIRRINIEFKRLFKDDGITLIKAHLNKLT
jgi:hypothetical protein